MKKVVCSSRDTTPIKRNKHARELRQIAKKALQDSVAVAYYRISDDEDGELSEEEKRLVINYMNQYGAAMCKAIGVNYVTY